MRRVVSTLHVVAMAAAVPAAAESVPAVYALKSYAQGPGQIVRIESFTDTRGGRMTVRRGATEDRGRMGLRRERHYERRILNDGTNVTLEYKVLKDEVGTSMKLDGPAASQVTESALTGKVILGFRDSGGRWRLFLKRRTASNRQAAQLAELEAYENRSWFLDRPVKVGDTWTIDPAFVRHLSERDVDFAEVAATATLKDVLVLDGERTAVIGFNIRSQGARRNPLAHRSSGVMVSLTGSLHVALDTMLDKKLFLEGSFTTLAREGDISTIVELPFKTEVVKTIVR